MRSKRQTWRRIAILAILLTIPAASVRADAVTDWNAIAVQAIVTAGSPPGSSARVGPTGVIDLAMVQAAVNDAVQSIERRYEPYYVQIPGASGSPVAATAKAAHDVLVSRFPAQAGPLGTTYQNYLITHGIPANDPGIAVGATAAAGIIALRTGDGSFPNPAPPPFFGGLGIGVWRPTPPANAPMLAPWLGNVTPFTLTQPSQFLAPAPPALTSWQYYMEYNEVQFLGALNNSSRTPEQTDQAHFWNLNYLVVWNQVFRNISGERVNDIAESAQLFALGNVAMADAIITSWNSKNFHVSWRPITAIQEGENDGNPWTVGDPTWQSLIVNPPYPDQSSGANNISSAALRSLELFFRTDDVTFSVTTTNTGPTVQDTRTFHRFSDARQEVVDARIYQGIHFRFADEDARTQGIQVSDWAYSKFVRRLLFDLDDGNCDDSIFSICPGNN